jgi:predicted transcriptional regulator
LKQDLPIADAKIAFTVKLSERLVERLRSYANTRGLSLSDIVSRALEAFLPRRKKRG